MKYSKEQIKEVFGGIWKKILSRNRRGNIQKHDVSTDEPTYPQKPESSANTQMSLGFSGRKKHTKSSRKSNSKKPTASKPRQLSLPLNLGKKQIIKPYTDVKRWMEDNWNDDYTYVGINLGNLRVHKALLPDGSFIPGTKLEPMYISAIRANPGVFMEEWNDTLKEKQKIDKANAEALRKSSQSDSPTPEDEDLSLSKITSMIQEIVEEELNEINHTTDSSGNMIIAQGASGSVVRFATEHPDVIKQMRDWIKDCQWDDLPDEAAVDELSDEEVLRGIQNNYDGGIKDFLRGSNSQAQVPVGYKESLKENWSSGQQDDAPDGFSNDYQRAFAHSQATTPRENQTEKAKQLAKTGKFVVLVGYPVYCRTTDAVLGISTTIEKVCNSREEAEKELEKFNTAEHSDDHVSIIGPDNLEPKQHKDTPGDDVPFQEGVGYVYDKDMKKDPKHIPGERWGVKYEEGFSKSELRGVIKELISEMWYGSKNDVDGDETHDEPLNEILWSYDKMIEFVKALPPEEQEKLNQMSKELGASAAVIKYLEDLAKQEPKEPMNESSEWNPQPLPQDEHKIAEIIHSLKEGTGVFFSYDNVTGHSSDWIWIQCVSDGDTISYYMNSKGESAMTDLEDDSMIDDVAQEIASGGYHFFTIQSVRDYVKTSRPSHHPEDDQELGHYELYGADQPEPQY